MSDTPITDRLCEELRTTGCGRISQQIAGDRVAPLERSHAELLAALEWVMHVLDSHFPTERCNPMYLKKRQEIVESIARAEALTKGTP